MKRKKISGCFLAVLLILALALPVSAASGKTPSAVSVTKAVAAAKSVTVTWKKAANVTSYRVYYKKAGAKKWTTLATVNSKTTKYVHKTSGKYPLKAGKKYTYTVRGYNKYSKRWGKYDTKGRTVTIPVIPSEVRLDTAGVTSKGEAVIQWKKASNVTEYQVYYRQASSTKWTMLAKVNNKTFEYIHKSSSKYPLKAGSTYYYTVKGYNKTYKTYGAYNKKGLLVKTMAKPKPTATPKPDDPAQIKKDIQEVIRLTNKVRAKYGKAPLKENAALDAGAAVRAKEVYTKFSHTRPDGTDSSTAYYQAGAGNICGENIAGGGSPEGVVEAWEQSTGHLIAMIRDDITHIGIGYYKGCWVQGFAENPDQKFTLTVDANGGTFPDKGGVEKYSIQVPAKMTVQVKDVIKPIKENADFEKWTSIDGTYGIESGASTSVHMFDNQTLKANWKEK